MRARRTVAVGFTLLETLVALTLVALLLAVAVPALIVPPGVSLRTTADQVATGLRQARLAAIRQQRPVALLLDVNAHALQVEGGSRIRQLPRDIQLELFSAAGEIYGSQVGGIRFFPDGSSTGGRVTLRFRGLETMVDVQWLTGRIRIQETGA